MCWQREMVCFHVRFDMKSDPKAGAEERKALAPSPEGLCEKDRVEASAREAEGTGRGVERDTRSRRLAGVSAQRV